MLSARRDPLPAPLSSPLSLSLSLPPPPGFLPAGVRGACVLGAPFFAFPAGLVSSLRARGRRRKRRHVFFHDKFGAFGDDASCFPLRILGTEKNQIMESVSRRSFPAIRSRATGRRSAGRSRAKQARTRWSDFAISWETPVTTRALAHRASRLIFSCRDTFPPAPLSSCDPSDSSVKNCRRAGGVASAETEVSARSTPASQPRPVNPRLVSGEKPAKARALSASAVTVPVGHFARQLSGFVTTHDKWRACTWDDASSFSLSLFLLLPLLSSSLVQREKRRLSAVNICKSSRRRGSILHAMCTALHRDARLRTCVHVFSIYVRIGTYFAVYANVSEKCNTLYMHSSSRWRRANAASCFRQLETSVTKHEGVSGLYEGAGKRDDAMPRGTRLMRSNTFFLN